MDRKTTTDLAIIRKEPHRFTWGEITKITDLGCYTFVEYEATRGEPAIHIYVNGKDISRGTRTMEAAMLMAISFSRLSNPNEAGWMASAAAKLFDLNLPI